MVFECPFLRSRLDAILWASTLSLTAVAVKRIAFQSFELAAGTSYAAAFDLHLRYVETARWLAGSPVYSATHTDYPPASYAILGPLLGGFDWPAARVLWLVLSLASLLVLSGIAMRAVDGRPAARALAAVLPWAAYGSALTVGVGQLGLLVLATGLSGVLLARSAAASLLKAAVAGLLFTISLVKPTFTAPWIWLLLLIDGPPVAACSAVILYGVATCAASAFQPEPLLRQLAEAVQNGRIHTPRGYGNLASWALSAGLGGLILPLAVLALAALGLWVLRHRAADVWVLLGVSALASRLFTYHYYVDDLLVIVPMIALLRLALGDSGTVQRTAAAVLAAAVLAQLIPTRCFTELGSTVALATETVQVLVWLAAGAVLASSATLDRRTLRFRDGGGSRE
jgi:glycosyl transferase family 87